jgi:hypothetical protein
MKALATWSPAPFLNVTAVEREESRWLVTAYNRERVCNGKSSALSVPMRKTRSRICRQVMMPQPQPRGQSTHSQTPRPRTRLFDLPCPCLAVASWHHVSGQPLVEPPTRLW